MVERPDYAVRELAALVADPDFFAGGGVIAAATLAGAAGTAELVATLSRRRRKLTDAQLRELDEIVERLRRQREWYVDAIHHDLAALKRLMSAMRRERESRGSDDQTALQELDQAVQQAIEVPVEAAVEGVRLLELVHRTVPLARSFTRSDLGASASMANGAIVAMCLMARANLGMLSDRTIEQRWKSRVIELEATAQDLSDRIIAEARGESVQLHSEESD